MRISEAEEKVMPFGRAPRSKQERIPGELTLEAIELPREGVTEKNPQAKFERSLFF